MSTLSRTVRRMSRYAERGLDHHQVRSLRHIQQHLAEGLAGVGRILLVGAAITDQRAAHRLAERAVERGRVLRPVRHDRHVGGPGAVQRRADGADLAVHHPAGRHHVGSGGGVRLGHRRVDLHRGVVVDHPGRRQHPAVAVVGELVQADVRHHQGGVADLVPHRTQRDVEDPVLGQRGRTGGVLVLVGRDAEQHDPGQTGVGHLGRDLADRLQRVLDDPRHRGDRPRLRQTLGDEHRQDQLPGLDRRLGHHRPHRRVDPEPARADQRVQIRHDIHHVR